MNFVLSICLTCEWLMDWLFLFCLLPPSSLTQGNVAQLPRCRHKSGGQLWTQLPKGHMSSRFRRVLWWHAWTWLSKWPTGHQKWHNTNAETHQHANHTHLLLPKENRITLTKGSWQNKLFHETHPIKGIVYPRKNFMWPFTHPFVVPSYKLVFLLWNTKYTVWTITILTEESKSRRFETTQMKGNGKEIITEFSFLGELSL